MKDADKNTDNSQNYKNNSKVKFDIQLHFLPPFKERFWFKIININELNELGILSLLV